MPRFSGFHTHVRKIPLSIPASVRSDDIFRMEQSWFGPRFCAQRRDGVSLFVGGRSGLECLLHLHYAPAAVVHVVEPDPAIYKALSGLFAENEQVKIYENIESFLECNRELSVIDFSRVDDSHYSTVWMLLEKFKIRALATEIPFSESIYDISEKIRPHIPYLYLAKANGGGRGFDKPRPEVAVSVVVPAYGVADQLPQCLESLANQSLDELEVIVVDDGSPDRCGAIADSYAAKYPDRFRVIHKKNGGCASARNAGMAIARGQFVGFVDGDDWVTHDMYADLYKKAIEDSADVAQGSYKLAYENGIVKSSDDVYAGNSAVFKRYGIVDRPLDLLSGQPTIWRRIYSRDLLAENGILFPEHIKRFDDLPFQFEALSMARRITTTAKEYYYYRQGRFGQDILAKDEKLFVHFEIFDYLNERITSRMRAEVIEQLLRVEINTHVWALGRLDKNLVADYTNRAIRSLQSGYKMLSSERTRLILKHAPPEAAVLLENAFRVVKKR